MTAKDEAVFYMTIEELKKRFPNASRSFLEANTDDHRTDSLPSRPKPERNQAPALGQAKKREVCGMVRPVVQFIGYRVRPLDPDNFAGGCKDLLDGLRHSGLIPGDENWRIQFATDQEKVSSRKEEKTVIRITYP